MSDLRPNDEDGGEGAALLRAAARQRAVAAADLFLPESLRLTDWQRATVRFLLEKLIRAVEDELRSSLAVTFAAEEALHAALSSAYVAIAQPILEGSRALTDAELVSVLFRRAEEHRFHRSAEAQPAVLAQLVRDPDQALAGAAMAVLIATSRRFDRFQEPVMARTELGAELQHRLVWTVAAALRRYIVEQHGIAPETADEAVASAAAAMLSAYDEGETLEARAIRLAHRLHAANRLADLLLVRVSEEGNLPLLIAALAARKGLGYSAAWEILSAPGERGAPLLLKAAGLGRQEAASILLRLGAAAPQDDEALAAQIDLFDVTTFEEAQLGLRLWSHDAAYRAAILRVGEAA